MRRQRIRAQRKHAFPSWPIDPTSAQEETGNLPAWPDNKRFSLILTHDVESERGRDQCLKLAQLEKELEFRSSFNFVAGDYEHSPELLDCLRRQEFEIGIHGFHHKGNLFKSRRHFLAHASEINFYLEELGAVGFRCPSMYHNLDWIHDLDIEYDLSTFDTDPFEPQADGVGTIHPFFVRRGESDDGYVELPYTLPQDFTLFVLMEESTIDIWKRKLDWIAENEGMALLNTHPDYMNFTGRRRIDQYPSEYYTEFLQYVSERYAGQYWNSLPIEMARFWRSETVEMQPVAASAGLNEQWKAESKFQQ